MVLDYFSDLTDITDNLKDSKFKMVLVGYVIPVCILLVVVVNLAVGITVVPSGHHVRGDMLDGLVQSHPYGWPFAGVVTAKIGLAAALFSWYGLANHRRTEGWAELGLLLSIVVIAVGLGIHVVGSLL